VPEDYQLKICIAGPDGTCAKTFIR
jgi:hypothetical protein